MVWDIESRDLDRRPLGPSALKTMHIDELRREVVQYVQHNIKNTPIVPQK